MPLAIVTGGAGFIGSHMVDLLCARGFEVRVVDNLSGGRRENVVQDVELDTRDIRELPPTAFEGADYVFHFAGIGDIVPSIERPVEYMDVNVQGTVRVLEAARHAGVKKFVYAASSSCYGLAQVPTSEMAPMAPKYPYALSKYLGELSVLHWQQVYGLPTNSIRIFNAYGPRSRTSGAYGAVMGVFLKQKLEGKPFTVVGDGTQKRDFIYVTDVAEAFYAAAMTPHVGQVYNVGAGNPQSINTLVGLLGGEVVYVPKRPGEPDCTWADIAKTQCELGWQPRLSFTEGIARVMAEKEYWREAPLWDPESIAASTALWHATLK